jgi:TolB protein
MLLLLVVGIEFGHGWTGEVWSLADVLLVVFFAGVPFLAGVLFLLAGFAIRPLVGVAAVVLVAVIAGYASVAVPGAGAPQASQSVASPAWSPDGKRIAFVQASATPHEESGEGSSWSWTFEAEIAVVNADGSRVRTLTRTPNRLESDPVWSPTGEQIVFVSEDKAGNRDLFLISADGTTTRSLTRTGALDEHSPAWSPYGDKIVFVRTGAQEEELALGEWIGEIHVINGDGTGQRRLTSNGDEAEDSSPVWSPDGRKIAFSRGYGKSTVIVMNADGTDQRPISNPLKSGHSPAWSPDASQIAFISSWTAFGMFIADADGTDLHKLIGSEISESIVKHSWSPDGTQIVYCLHEDVTSDVPVGEIVVISANGTDRHNLTNTTLDESDPAWSPDGTWIAYVRDDNQIWLTRPDGSDQHKLYTAPQA